MQIANSRRNIY